MTVQSTARLLFLLGSMLGAACLVEPREDGESCDDDDECESNHCVGGMCTGSSCDVDQECRGGFTCAEPGTVIEIFSLGLASGTCVPTCSVCPLDDPRWSCSGQSCIYDDTPVVDAGGPYEGVVGEPVRLVGSAAPVDGRDIVSASWSSWEEGVLGEGLEIDAVFTIPGMHTLALDVQDEEYASARASATVVLCSPDEGPCGRDDHCCGTGELVCMFTDDPYNGVCSPPPVCGDGVIEGAEECDGAPPPIDCSERGQFHPAPVGCSESCYADISECVHCGMTFDDCFVDSDCCAGYVCEYESCRPV